MKRSLRLCRALVPWALQRRFHYSFFKFFSSRGQAVAYLFLFLFLPFLLPPVLLIYPSMMRLSPNLMVPAPLVISRRQRSVAANPG